MASFTQGEADLAFPASRHHWTAPSQETSSFIFFVPCPVLTHPSSGEMTGTAGSTPLRCDQCCIKLEHNLSAFVLSASTIGDQHPIWLLNICHPQGCLVVHQALTVSEPTLSPTTYGVCPSLISIPKIHHLTVITIKLHLPFSCIFHQHFNNTL